MSFQYGEFQKQRNRNRTQSRDVQIEQFHFEPIPAQLL